MKTKIHEKTQISALQYGSQFVGGTNHKERERIGTIVMKENGEKLRVRLDKFDEEVELSLYTTKTGKTKYYGSKQLSTSLVKKICPFDYKAIEHPELVYYTLQIDEKMFVTVVTSRRSRVTRQWKPGRNIPLDEKDVTIL